MLRKVFHLEKEGRDEKLGASKEWECTLANTGVISAGSEILSSLSSSALQAGRVPLGAAPELIITVQTLGRIYWLVWMLHELLVSYLSTQSTARRPV